MIHCTISGTRALPWPRIYHRLEQPPVQNRPWPAGKQGHRSLDTQESGQPQVRAAAADSALLAVACLISYQRSFPGVFRSARPTMRWAGCGRSSWPCSATRIHWWACLRRHHWRRLGGCPGL